MTRPTDEQIEQAIAFERKHGTEEVERMLRLNLLDERTYLIARMTVRIRRAFLALDRDSV